MRRKAMRRASRARSPHEGKGSMLQQDIDPQETREWLEALDAVVEHDGPDRAQHLLERVVGHAQLTGAAPAPAGDHALHQHDPAATRAASTRSTASSNGASARSSAGTRWRWWCAQQGILRARRPHRELPVGGDALRHRLQPFLARAVRRATAATSSTSRAIRRRASTRARSSRGASTEEQLEDFRQEVGGNGPAVVSASVADAGLLAVPDRLDGARADHGHLPGAVHASYLAGPRPRRHRRAQGLGLPGRRRDRRAGVARRDLAGRRARSSTTSSSSSTATCSASTARCAATARSSRSSRAVFRGAGWNVIKVIWGSRLGRAARARPRRPAAARAWRRPSTASTRTSSRATAPTCASTSSASTRSCWRWSPT